jgi:hypothetical protein
LEVWSAPATICYSTQSFPARPIQILVRTDEAWGTIASYRPARVSFCDRHVDRDIAVRLIAERSAFVVRWSPQVGDAVVDTPLEAPEAASAER